MAVACRRSLHYWWLMVVVVVLTGKGKGQLVQNFYASTCPMAEAVVKQAVTTKFSQTFTTIPATLRLFFHDCFVEVMSSKCLIFCSNEVSNSVHGRTCRDVMLRL